MTVVLALVASVLWGAADFGGGVLSRRQPVFLVMLVSQALGLAALLLVAGLSGAYDDPGNYLPWGVAAGVAGWLGFLAFYRALAIGPMGLVAAITGSAVLVPVGAGMVGGERPSVVQVAGMVAAVVGVVLASGPRSEGAAIHRRVVLLALVAALGFGTAVWCIGAGAEQNLSMVLVVQRCTNVLLGATLLVALRPAVSFTPRELPALAFVGTAEVGANAAYGVAAGSGLVSVAAVLSSLYPVVTALLARWLLGERLTSVQRYGAAVAVSGVVLFAAH